MARRAQQGFVVASEDGEPACAIGGREGGDGGWWVRGGCRRRDGTWVGGDGIRFRGGIGIGGDGIRVGGFGFCVRVGGIWRRRDDHAEVGGREACRFEGAGADEDAHAAGLQAAPHGEVEGHGLETQPGGDLGGGGAFGVGGVRGQDDGCAEAVRHAVAVLVEEEMAEIEQGGQVEGGWGGGGLGGEGEGEEGEGEEW